MAYPQLEVSGNTAQDNYMFDFIVTWSDEGGQITAADIADAIASLVVNKYPGTTLNSRRLTSLSSTNV